MTGPGSTPDSSGAGPVAWLLSDFASRTPGVIETILVSADGFLLAQSSDDTTDVEQLAAIISGIISLTKGAAGIYGFAGVQQVIVEMAGGYLFVMSVSDGSAVASLSSTTADVGTVGYELTLLAERLGEVLSPEVMSSLKNVLVRPGDPAAP
ncbi:MAG: roadblock/LC7 domain-containing protein [Actinomycetota bacterium]